jgi:hypothetical protein
VRCARECGRRRQNQRFDQFRLEHALASRRVLGDAAWQALILNFLGELASGQDDLSTAKAHFGASLAIRRELGDKWGIPQVLTNLASIARAQGDVALAFRLHAEAVEQFQRLNAYHGVADCLEGFAELAARIWRRRSPGQLLSFG